MTFTPSPTLALQIACKRAYDDGFYSVAEAFRWMLQRDPLSAASSATLDRSAEQRAEAGERETFSSGSPTWAALAVGSRDCNGVEKCREALTRQESPAPVTTLSNREGIVPPLEPISRRYTGNSKVEAGPWSEGNTSGHCQPNADVAQ